MKPEEGELKANPSEGVAAILVCPNKSTLSEPKSAKKPLN